MVNILGPDGRPIRRADLPTPQTAQIAWLQHTVAGHPSRGLTPSKLARLLDDAENGDIVAQYELFEDMEEKDAHISAEMGKRFAALEIEWGRDDGVWAPRAITHRPQSWFKLHRGVRQEIRLRDGSGDGMPLNPLGWLRHTHRAKSGYIERASLFRVLAWPYLFKNYSVGDLAEFLEIYGLALRLGKYPPRASAPPTPRPAPQPRPPCRSGHAR